MPLRKNECTRAALKAGTRRRTGHHKIGNNIFRKVCADTLNASPTTIALNNHHLTTYTRSSPLLASQELL